MVFFSCDNCGESLKKNKVDQHASRCGCASVSCIDCSVSFWGDDYKQHISCITEAERYEKSVYKGPKKNDTNGRKLTPQEAWNNLISDAYESSPINLKEYLRLLSSYDNVPRKEKPFRNFSSNSLKLRGTSGEATITAIWKYLSNFRTNKQNQGESEQIQSTVEPKQQQCSHDSFNHSSVREKPLTEKKYGNIEAKKKDLTKTITKAMKKALKKAPNKSLKVKELRSVLNAILSEKNEAFEKKHLKKAMKDAISSNKHIFRWSDDTTKSVQLVE